MALQPTILQPKGQRSRKKMMIWIAIVLVGLLAVSSVGISIFVGWSLTHKERKAINELPSDYGLSYRDISFLSRDGKTQLNGWSIEPSGQKAKMTVIFSHGYGGNRIEPNVGFLSLGKHFVDAGYRIILFDFRAAGVSGGSMTTVGAKEKLDLLGAIDWVKKNTKEPIALYGVSMGAATSLLAGSESPDVQGIVADSPFSDLRSYLKANMSVWTHLPNFPYTPLILWTIPMISGLNLDEASPIHEIENFYPRPILFIHGSGDTAIPDSESRKMVALHPDVFTFWSAVGSDHVKGYQDHPTEYVAQVLGFFDHLAASLK